MMWACGESEVGAVGPGTTLVDGAGSVAAACCVVVVSACGVVVVVGVGEVEETGMRGWK